MIRQLDAIYENGLLRPLEPLALGESQRVRITISDATGSSVQRLMDHALLEEIRAEVATIERHPTLDEVRAALATISGNMSDVVLEERGDY
jgi:predicted DNA-binding antitoxin AbrB/MazE fold protein